ncbi:MAG TPA: hypothetical protein VFS60_06120, partial [Thermoanaerobaculia bacterium]|nr:hypothetical protein [Thermoanaerobaculia bacterium]
MRGPDESAPSSEQGAVMKGGAVGAGGGSTSAASPTPRSFGGLVTKASARENRRAALPFVTALVIEVLALGGLTAAGDPTRRPLLTLLLLGVAALALPFVVRGAARAAVSPAAILGAAALLRLLLVPLPPTLSSDVWRYLWEGRIAAGHGNPYRLAPD